ncbi:sigma-70 family RNA polymerase sigma factor [Marininema halotolerans]|uniref:RNA polymerase sigma factor n=1 Tax=Marininema halotolerans TaxID=1155944 RepID=UPI000B8710B8
MVVVEAGWVEDARRGNRVALARLLKEVEGPVYRTAYYMLGNEQDALDASQEALLRIYRKLSSFRGEARFETWAQRIAIHAAIDISRKRKQTLPYKDEIEPSGSSGINSTVERRGTAADVHTAINRLQEAERTAVVLRYLQDYTYDQIAEAMEMPVGTVKSHLFRGRKKLKGWLADYKEGGVLS